MASLYGQASTTKTVHTSAIQSTVPYLDLIRGSKHSCCYNLLHCHNQPHKVSSQASPYNIRRTKTVYAELMANRHSGSMFLWSEQLCTPNTCIMIIYVSCDMTSRCVAILLWFFTLHWTSLCCTEGRYIVLRCRTYQQEYRPQIAE